MKSVFRPLIVSAIIVIAALFWCQLLFVTWTVTRTVHYVVQLSENSIKDTVVITADDTLRWAKEDEVEINGNMFDVALRYTTGSNLFLIGHWDAEDDLLIKWLTRLIDSNDDEDFIKVGVWFFDGIIPSSELHFRGSLTKQIASRHLFYYGRSLISRTFSIDLPPPRTDLI